MIIAIGNDERHPNMEKIEERDPMQTMQGLISFPMAEAEELIDMEKNLMSVKRIISLMGSQINELLEYTKMEKGLISPKKQSFSKDDLRKQIEFLLQPLCEDKELSYRIDFDGMEDVTFMTDKGMLVQLFWQLLDNAAQYTEEGGRITFQAYTKERTLETVTNCFVIRDNGIGMSRQFQEYLFQPFMRERNRLSESIEGTGLGMYIVQQIVKIMDGEIQVESKENEGTSFTITITSPCCSIMHEGKTKFLEDLTILRKKRVLLCEDRVENAMQTCKRLENAGMLVDIAKDGYEAIELFRNSKLYYYDAVLMNVRMKAINGLETTSRIRHLDREDAYLIPFVALIFDTYDENMIKPIEGGMDAQIDEPVDIGELLKHLVTFWKRYKE
ncbi:MAG: hybrid sensor histidine kinase/response regulator [Lachnospiraceae bacterium]|nr:hybrid sensor histidine kinase/response regulator [Lachnospiraceae bacterium]